MRLKIRSSPAPNSAVAAQTMRARIGARGFTLLELLVVLAIIGLISAVAMPQLSTLTDRVAFAMNREQVERALASLPYTAYKQHRDFILGAPKVVTVFDEDAAGLMTYDLKDRDGARPLIVEAPVLLTPAPIQLPQGWTLQAEPPLIYRSSGLCTGGEVVLKAGAVAYTYTIAAPACQPQLK